MNLKNLQNGSDIRGIAGQSDEKTPINLTKNIAAKLGLAFSKWLSLQGTKKAIIGVGTDPRLSGPSLKQGIIEGICSYGNSIMDFGLATTPAVFMSTKFSETKCDAAIMITASHLPANRNGFKFFTPLGGLEKEDITELINIAEHVSNPRQVPEIRSVQINLIELYSNFLVQTIRNITKKELPLDGTKIIIDAGNGSGGFFADSFLKKLGADTSGSVFLEPDGTFPNHAPNPEDKKAIHVLQEKVLQTNADLGIIFDTDVDRAAIVSSTGKPINRNALIAMISSIILEEHPKSTIVTDSVTSSGLTQFIEMKGGKHHRYMRGYKNIINEGIRLNEIGEECWLSIETSGHAALKENYFLDDGAFLIARILAKFAQLNESGLNLNSLIEGLQEPLEEKEVRIKILDENYKSYGQKIIDGLKEFVTTVDGWYAEKENYEGYRVNCRPGFGNGWFLLRLSLHDPVLPLNIESNNANGTIYIFNKLLPFFRKYGLLEIPSLI